MHVNLMRSDFNYVEARLLSPMDRASEAHARLKGCGRLDLANRLMQAMQVFNDECRAIRNVLQEEQNQ